MGFLYKELTLKEKEKIKLESKKLMDSFGEKLSKVKKLPNEGFIERASSLREENLKFNFGGEFKEKILKNAKNKNEDFIIAEKKKW